MRVYEWRWKLETQRMSREWETQILSQNFFIHHLLMATSSDDLHVWMSNKIRNSDSSLLLHSESICTRSHEWLSSWTNKKSFWSGKCVQPLFISECSLPHTCATQDTLHYCSHHPQPLRPWANIYHVICMLRCLPLFTVIELQVLAYICTLYMLTAISFPLFQVQRRWFYSIAKLEY